MKLPAEFLNKMKSLLGEDEFESFLSSFDKSRYYGLRVNTLKISVEDFLKISPFKLEPVPWTRDGFYYEQGENPGKHPFYHAGLYYIQEPSAMLPAAVLNPQPGEHVLDLCAAPGGKTVQLAASMKGKGLLVANDISSDRVKALVKNIELCGVRNAVVTNDTPQKLASNLEGFFDRILVDAPCSGEGMFRKDEDAAKSWENFKCEKCASMQREILKHVDTMLKPGGYILYSTCTFSPEEDEIMITEFLDENNDYELCKIPLTAGIERGRPLWADGNERLEKTVRLWPHKLKGEGHFAALLRKKPGTKKTIFSLSPAEKKYDISIFKAFVKENLNIDMEGFFDIKGNNLYWLPEQPPEMRGIKVAKFGWYLGELSHGKFQPSHSMLTALNKKDFKNVIDFHGDSREINSYLKGETLMVEGQKGYWAVCVDGYTIGLAKQTGDVLKNMYPKGWRKMN